MILKDVEPFEAYDCKTDGCCYEGDAFHAYVNGMQHVLEDLDSAPEIDPESLPVVQQLWAELEKVKAEREAAIRDIPKTCKTCRYGNSPCDWCQYDPDGELNWEWRGVKEN